MSWSTIESDPGVFTELIETYGAQDVQVEELYSMDNESFQALGTDIYGLIFLFKYENPSERHSQGQEAASEYRQYLDDPRIYFANQVINNACATQAILHVLFNAPKIELGETLSNFKSFTHDFPPELRGESMNDSEDLRTAHNSFSRPEPFVIEESKSGASEDTYHYIAYVPFENQVIELDGLSRGPISIGTTSEDRTWTQVAAEAIQRRMQQYGLGEIRFNLLAICKDKRKAYREGINRLKGNCSLEQLDQSSANRARELEEGLQEEEQKRRRWHIENQFRKHNFLPFNMELLRILAEQKQLEPMYEAALEKEKQARQRENQSSHKSAE
eukprot:gb/GECG01016489.1/.p1 GENE.gb/GECG01016489.1/~~gb/GECG01016489.1/.p1  ORF type:complete len:330 (+),score=47.35 gb/GECG01016489.1/:1-990(+)